jgi:hypothetical protein
MPRSLVYAESDRKRLREDVIINVGGYNQEMDVPGDEVTELRNVDPFMGEKKPD